MFDRVLIFVFLLEFGCINLHATDLFSQRLDTYISEKNPNQEFSKSQYLIVSSEKGSKAIAYLTFHANLTEIGFQPERDEVMFATLVLRYKKGLPKEYNTSKEKELSTKDVLTKVKESTEQKIQQLTKDKGQETKSEFKIYAIIDDETFVPDSNNCIVSWNGKKNAPAPKHNNIDDELYDDGTYVVGEFTIDFAKNKLEDADEITINSDSLAHFLNFAFGATKAQNKYMHFRSQLDRLERICLIIVQTSGKIPLSIYSANFAENSKPESGDDVKKTKQKVQENATNTSSSLPMSMLNKALQNDKELNSENNSNTHDEQSDYRPKINFEFRGN